MTTLTLPSPTQYLVDEDGRRVGVVFTWQEYEQLQSILPKDPDILPGLDEMKLRSLADGLLASPFQERLNELLERNRESDLSAAEEAELDELLERVDELNILKARALYTLKVQQGQVE